MGKLIPKTVHSPLVGIQHRMALPAIRKLADEVPMLCTLEREPDNFMDKNAIKVIGAKKGSPFNGVHVGYVPKEVAQVMANSMDGGKMEIHKVTLVSVDADHGRGELKIKLAMARK